MGDSTFRRSTTGSFCCIFHFVGRRQTVFEAFLAFRGLGSVEIRVFCQSEGSEAWKIVFFIRPRGRKGCFWRFLLIRGVGKVVFGYFCSSEASDGLFFIKSRSHEKECGKSISQEALHENGIMILAAIEEPMVQDCALRETHF